MHLGGGFAVYYLTLSGRRDEGKVRGNSTASKQLSVKLGRLNLIRLALARQTSPAYEPGFFIQNTPHLASKRHVNLRNGTCEA